MMSGLTLRMSSTLMRSLARASGRKLVRKTSLRLISSSSTSLAPGTSRERPTLRLPRLGVFDLDHLGSPVRQDRARRGHERELGYFEDAHTRHRLQHQLSFLRNSS